MSLTWEDLKFVISEIQNSAVLPLKITGFWQAKGEDNISLPFLFAGKSTSEKVSEEYLDLDFGLWFSLTNSRTWMSLIPNRIDRGKEDLFSIKVRRELLGLSITTIRQLEKDRSVFLFTDSWKIIVLELFPGRPNFLILSRDNQNLGEVLFSMHPTPKKGEIYKNIEVLKEILKIKDCDDSGTSDFADSASLMDNPKSISTNEVFSFNKQIWQKYRQNERVDAKLRLLRAQAQKQKHDKQKIESIYNGLCEAIKKNEKRLALKAHGELLRANMYRFGEYHNSDQLDIDGVIVNIDSSKSLADNLNIIFSNYKKSKNALIDLEKRKLQTQKLLEEKNSEYEHTLEELQSLDAQNGISPRNKKDKFSDKLEKGKKAKKEIELPCKVFDIRENVKCFIGRNASENEFIVMKLSQSEDYWFHIKNKVGAHGILKMPKGKTPSIDDLIFVAKLVAKYSGIKSGNKVDVDYTKRKFVKRIKNAGKSSDGIFNVQYERNKSLYVEVD